MADPLGAGLAGGGEGGLGSLTQGVDSLHTHHHHHNQYTNDGINLAQAGLDNVLHPNNLVAAAVLPEGVQQGGDAHRMGGLKADGTSVLLADGGGEESRDKVDRRYGKRTETAKQAVSIGMRSKAQNRKERSIQISLGDRMRVATKLENKEMTPKEAMDQLGCCKSYISQMMKPGNLAKLRKKAELGLSFKLTKAHLPKFPQLEEELNRWADSMRKSNPNNSPPVSMSLMQEKALELANHMGLPDFKASNSWFSNFVKRYGLDRSEMGFQQEDAKRGGVQHQMGHDVGGVVIGDVGMLHGGLQDNDVQGHHHDTGIHVTADAVPAP